MIKIEDGDETGCVIEIHGNAEVIAQQTVCLIKELNDKHPYIYDRVLFYLRDVIENMCSKQ
jgi:hypothetical protein